VERGRGIGLVWERFRMGEDGLHWTSLDILDGLRRGVGCTLGVMFGLRILLLSEGFSLQMHC